MIDLHAHLLPGFDDGVRSLAEARQLAREAAAAGVTVIAATPHVRADYPTAPDRMERGVAALRADFAEQRIDVEVVRGGELALERLWELPADEVRRFTYDGAGGHLLVEFPYAGWPALLAPTVEELRRAGIRAVLAHPERNGAVQADPRRLAPLVDAGALVQVTAGSVTGTLGAHAQSTAQELLELDLVGLVATDSHGPHVGGRGSLAAAAESLGDAALARRLTLETPAAILGRA